MAAQTNTCEGHVTCYSIWYEITHHQLPETWSEYLRNAFPYSLIYRNDVKKS